MARDQPEVVGWVCKVCAFGLGEAAHGGLGGRLREGTASESIRGAAWKNGAPFLSPGTGDFGAAKSEVGTREHRKNQPFAAKPSSKFVSPRFTVGSCTWAIAGRAVAAAHKSVRRKSDTSLTTLGFVVLSERITICLMRLQNAAFSRARNCSQISAHYADESAAR